MQHIFDEHARLRGEIGVHLLQCRIVARGEIEHLDTVETLDTDTFACSIRVSGFQLPLTTDADQHQYDQYSVNFLHVTNRGNINFLKNTMQNY